MPDSNIIYSHQMQDEFGYLCSLCIRCSPSCSLPVISYVFVCMPTWGEMPGYMQTGTTLHPFVADTKERHFRAPEGHGISLCVMIDLLHRTLRCFTSLFLARCQARRVGAKTQEVSNADLYERVPHAIPRGNEDEPPWRTAAAEVLQPHPQTSRQLHFHSSYRDICTPAAPEVLALQCTVAPDTGIRLPFGLPFQSVNE
jgi:hypothetical protein